MSVSLQVTVHLHNAGATLLTGVGFLDSSYWRSWFGRAGRELPWEPQGCLWSQTQTHTHANTLTQLLTGTFWQSLCSSHQHSVCLHRSLSAELVCVSPLVFTSSAPEGHASWNGFPHIGHYHFMKECRCYLDVFAQPFIKAEGGKEDTCISWSAVHNINGTQESSSLHPAQVTATWKSKLGASYSHLLVLH